MLVRVTRLTSVDTYETAIEDAAVSRSRTAVCRVIDYEKTRFDDRGDEVTESLTWCEGMGGREPEGSTVTARRRALVAGIPGSGFAEVLGIDEDTAATAERELGEPLNIHSFIEFVASADSTLLEVKVDSNVVWQKSEDDEPEPVFGLNKEYEDED